MSNETQADTDEEEQKPSFKDRFNKRNQGPGGDVAPKAGSNPEAQSPPGDTDPSSATGASGGGDRPDNPQGSDAENTDPDGRGQTEYQKRQQMTMRLSDETMNDLNNHYERINALRQLEGYDKIQKNIDYFETVIRVAINSGKVEDELLPDDVEFR